MSQPLVEKEFPQLLYVSGDRSGVGKSTICLSILGHLLKSGIDAGKLAYIKPCTQCEDVQLISKWCEAKGIAHQGIGPVRFYQGFTAECIRGEDEGVEVRHKKIREAVAKIAQGKTFVLVDGVGYPAVGSVSGVSNAQVAALLGLPVLVVGRPGTGNAIDSFNMIHCYFQSFSVPVLGAVFNNIPKKVSYHTYESCKENVCMYFGKALPDVNYLGSVMQNDSLKAYHDAKQTETGGVACVLRATKSDLEISEEEAKLVEELIEWVSGYMDIPLLMDSIQQYYTTNQPQLL